MTTRLDVTKDKWLLRYRCAACGTCRLPCHVIGRSSYVCKTCVVNFIRALRVGLDKLHKLSA